MNTTTRAHGHEHKTRNLRKLQFALGGMTAITLIFLLAGAFLALVPPKVARPVGTTPVFTFLAACVAVLAVAGSILLSRLYAVHGRKRLARGEQLVGPPDFALTDSEQLRGLYMMVSVLRVFCVEFGVWFAVLAFFLETHAAAGGIAAVLLLSLMSMFPTHKRLMQWTSDQLEILEKQAAASGRKRHAHNLCYACGYNLTGNVSGVCPECGTKIRQKPD